tara:strand:+ start:475 stop:1044 length:570 start_codon:yes stop_codon:yes gene_type:complete
MVKGVATSIITVAVLMGSVVACGGTTQVVAPTPELEPTVGPPPESTGIPTPSISGPTYLEFGEGYELVSGAVVTVSDVRANQEFTLVGDVAWFVDIRVTNDTSDDVESPHFVIWCDGSIDPYLGVVQLVGDTYVSGDLLPPKTQIEGTLHLGLIPESLQKECIDPMVTLDWPEPNYEVFWPVADLLPGM